MVANDAVNSFIQPLEIKEDAVFPKYHQIHAQLKKELFFGGYESGQRFFSIRALREKYQVDKQTIQTALDLLIKEGFLYAKPASGIYVNGAYRRTVGMALGTVWFCQMGGEGNHPYYNGLLSALQRLAPKWNLNVIVNKGAFVSDFKTWFQPETGDGLILTGEFDGGVLKHLHRMPFSRYMVIGNYDLPEGTPNVHTKIEDAVFKALTTVSSFGRRKLAIIGVGDHKVDREVLRGVERAIETGALDLAEKLSFASNEEGCALASRWKRRFDCAFVSEPSYFTFCRHVFESGVKCPEELFVIRYGNNEGYEFYNDIAGLITVSDKTAIMDQVLGALFGNGSRRIDVEIELRLNPKVAKS